MRTVWTQRMRRADWLLVHFDDAGVLRLDSVSCLKKFLSETTKVWWTYHPY